MRDNENDDSDNKKVGYGRPPPGSQFKPGRSGNPKGRPRGSTSLSTLLEKALGGSVVVNENGRRKKISKADAMLKQLANKAALGDPRVAKFVFEQDYKSKGRRGDKPPPQSVELPDEFSYWVTVLLVLKECGALECAPLGLKDAIDNAQWDLVKKMAGPSPEDIAEAAAKSSEIQ